MKSLYPLAIALLFSTPILADDLSTEVYVETPFDTDGDGQLDRIYVSINRPNSTTKLPTILEMSPYALGGTEVPMHEVDVDELPQKSVTKFLNKSLSLLRAQSAVQYANLKAHSLGTGYSTGCPSVGDETEALAGKAVIDWLNGKANAFDKKGTQVFATWANGSVGMTGISYDGTLPIMIASTGVEGLKAIVPIAAISNWYDYYRANGLVVSPGGYAGEDADILGYYIVRKGACKNIIERISATQGRENGDFTAFWQKRNHLAKASSIKAATFIIHGQADWNVKQKHAIQLWEALDGVVPRRMFLHRGGHGSSYQHGVPAKIQAWFDHFVAGVENDITSGPQVEVELPNGQLMVQNEWPHESTQEKRLYFSAQGLVTLPPTSSKALIVDAGRVNRLESLANSPATSQANRLIYLSEELVSETVLSGTAHVQLDLALLNREAANITVALVSYDKSNNPKLITRGWADPQNYRDISLGEKLDLGKNYVLRFSLEPKQAKIPAGQRLGVLITSTDYEYTLRPKSGTQIQLSLGDQSFIDLNL